MHKFVLPRKVLRNRVLLLKIISVSGKYTHYLSAHKPLFLLFQGPNSAQLNKGEIRASYFSAKGCESKQRRFLRLVWTETGKALDFMSLLKPSRIKS